MSKYERYGNRKTREELAQRRVPLLGYYLIVTDTKETERNYLYGLRDSIPKDLQGKLVIKVLKTKTARLVEEAMEAASLCPQYSEVWIVFDRDEIVAFDEIIENAYLHGIHVGWSNPCIEMWFQAYFGNMPNWETSKKCCEGFSRQYESNTSSLYNKADAGIYKKLCIYGNERKAIQIAKFKLKEHKGNGKQIPSEMCPSSTLALLVEQIKSKINTGKEES